MAAGKRVQVMLRPEIYSIIEDLRDEDNLSDSKICSILIEQALVERSLWDKDTRKRIPKEATDDASFKSVTKTDILDGIELPPNVTVQTTTKHERPQTEDPEILELAKKLQALKAVGLF